MRSWLTGIIVLIAAAAAVAQTAASPTVSAAWARASAPHAAAAAVYLTVTETGGSDRLIGAATPAAAEAGLHESRVVGGVMQMRPAGPQEVSAGKALVLAPGGLHLMLTGLKAPLRPGQTFPITLRFEKAGAVTATVTVAKIGAPAPGGDMPGGGMPGGGMKGMDMPTGTGN